MGGLVCLAVAVFFAFMPGPAIPFWFFGAVLISSQLLIVARLLDKIELVTFNALQDKRKRRIIRWVIVPAFLVGSGIGTYMVLFKFLPQAAVIVCAVIGGAAATIVPYMLLKEKKQMAR
ncbi:MAG: hypothetical protein KA403_06885 [Candidatus Omnitrophica bacterium]|nr:hypothetical protein [Candidatus Omnitrophota bacterium]